VAVILDKQCVKCLKVFFMCDNQSVCVKCKSELRKVAYQKYVDRKKALSVEDRLTEIEEVIFNQMYPT